MNFMKSGTSSQQTTYASEMVLMNLNDDCLIKIFRYLSVADIAKVSEVCKLFKDLALTAFKTEWKEKVVNILNSSKELRIESMRIIREYCSILKKIHIGFGDNKYNEIFFDVIFEKCTLNLIEIEFSGPGYLCYVDKILNKRNMCRINKKFKYLRSLKFDCSTKYIVERQCIEQKFSYLEQLSLSDPFKNRNIETFVNLNPQLKRLSAFHSTEVKNARELVRLIDQNLPFLEHLGLWIGGFMDEMEYKPLFLKNLRRLHISNYGKANNLPYLSISNEKVEEMEFLLSSCDYRLFDFICQYKEVKKLSLRSYISNAFNYRHLLKLSKNLPKLTEIEINGLYKSLSNAEIVRFVLDTKMLRKFVIIDYKRANIVEDMTDIQLRLTSQWIVAAHSSRDSLIIRKSANRT